MGAGAFFKSLAMVTAWNHLWTIPVEMSFYVLLPAIAWPLAALNRRLGAGAVLLAASVLLLVQLLSFPFYATPDNSLNVGWYVPAFLFGCVAAVLKDAWQVRPGFRDALVLAILAGVAVSTPIAREALFGFEPTADLMNKHAFFGLAFAVLIWCVVDKASNWSAFFGARVMAYVGNISYPTYLLHWLVIVGLKDHLPQSWFTVLFFVAGSLALGAVAHMFIERPLMSWLKPSARRQPAYQT